MDKTLLIVDDKINLCKSLMYNFQRIGYRCRYATAQSAALDLFTRERYDAVILDVRLGEDNGLDLLRKLRSLDRTVPVIMLTGYSTIQDAVESIKHGAFDYVQKPANFNHLQTLVDRAVRSPELRDDGAVRSLDSVGSDTEIVTESPVMIELYARARKLAESDLPVLIYGESGTGKELLAELIHASSPRSDREMVKINCASFPDSLLDNELFGHEKGSFTGAYTSYQGVFEQAHRGTLFLDEISDMTISTQARILRAIQNQEIRRIGGKNVVRIDVRFIGATNRSIERMIDAGTFRNDLYYRMSAVLLEIPPLRERKEEIPVLCRYFLQTIGRHREEPLSLADSVLEVFLKHDWPGNIRELKNVIHYASAITTGSTIKIRDLPPGFCSRNGDDTMVGMMNMLDRVEKDRITVTLQKANYNKKKAAEMLSISRKTLYKKIEKYGITIPG